MHGIDGGVCSHVLILGSCNKYGDRPNRVFSIELGRMYGARRVGEMVWVAGCVDYHRTMVLPRYDWTYGFSWRQVGGGSEK